LPHIKVDGKRIIDSTGALALTEVPGKMLVIGGGYIGLEMSSVYARLGTEVTVVEAFDSIVPAMDADLRAGLFKSLQKQGLKFHLSTKVTEAKVSGSKVMVKATDKDGKTLDWEVDYVLVCVGRKPFTAGLGLEDVGIKVDDKGRIPVDGNFRTTAEGVYAVGDVIDGPMLAHKASEEGVVCVELMKGHKPVLNYVAIPAVVYTWPEMASVGLTEDEVKAKGYTYRVAKFPFLANGRAISMNDTEGFTKIIIDEKTDRILGGHILGPNASEMIHEFTVALEMGATAEDLARITHAHPTLSESVKEAALGVEGGFLNF
jgi:dihydrolipoamide dehydrogenase